MPQFLVAIQHPENYDPSQEGEEMIGDISALNREMDAAGARFFAGGLESPVQGEVIAQEACGRGGRHRWALP